MLPAATRRMRLCRAASHIPAVLWCMCIACAVALTLTALVVRMMVSPARTSFLATHCGIDAVAGAPRRYTFAVRDPAALRPVHTESNAEQSLLARMREQRIANIRFPATLMAIANLGNTDLVLNWVSSLRFHGYRTFVVVCLDEGLYEALLARDLSEHAALVPPTWLRGATVDARPQAWGTPMYQSLTQAKLAVQLELLLRNVTFVYSDVDVVFTSPVALLHLAFVMGETFSMAKTRSERCFYELATMMDSHNGVVSANTGFFIALPSPNTVAAFTQALALSKTTKELAVDQAALNHVIFAARMPLSHLHLDPLLYPNGLVFLYKRKDGHETLRVCPLLVHFNFIIGETQKRRNMRESGLWFLL